MEQDTTGVELEAACSIAGLRYALLTRPEKAKMTARACPGDIQSWTAYSNWCKAVALPQKTN
jgi:hypothetical protein